MSTPASTTGPCPVDCGRTAPAGHLLCPACWHQLDDKHKRNVLRAYARWSTTFRNSHAHRAYQQAADAAINSLKETTDA